MTAMSDYLENGITDWLWRGAAAPTLGASVYIALMTADPGDPGPGTEVTGGGYARVGIARSLAAFAGTQAAATTVASTGTSGTTSNNAAISFPAPSAAWGNIAFFAIYDAATNGNLLWHGPLASAKTVNSGDAAPSFAPGTLTLQIDN